MFEQPTVFILGAGASWHYGYPTGEELVKRVIKAARNIKQFFEKSKGIRYIPQYISDECNSNWDKAIIDCQNLIHALEAVHPLVIDYFLSQNKDLQPIGKLMIAWVILECEANFIYKRHNENRLEILRNSPNFEDQKRVSSNLVDAKKYNDNWYRFIIHQLLDGIESSEDLLNSEKNNVKFITFNYDISLETQLLKGLKKIQLLDEMPENRTHVEEFFKNDRIIHIYGSIRDFQESREIISLSPDEAKKRLDIFTSIKAPPTEARSDYGLEINVIKEPVSYKNLLDEVYKSSRGIETIGIDKANSPEVIKAAEEAKDAIKKAKVVYILGYGFDRRNNDLLGLNILSSAELPYSSKKVLFTNYGDSNCINKKAGNLFIGNPNYFSKSGEFVLDDEYGDGSNKDYCWYYYEKSTKNVYDAFAYDFDII